MGYLRSLVLTMFAKVVHYHKGHFLVGRSTHAKETLELIHNDLVSVHTLSFLGAQYVLTFIDDFSRCTWVYFLKYKYDVFDSF